MNNENTKRLDRMAQGKIRKPEPVKAKPFKLAFADIWDHKPTTNYYDREK